MAKQFLVTTAAGYDITAEDLSTLIDEYYQDNVVKAEEVTEDLSLIPTKNLKSMEGQVEWLECLEAAGVDNWEGCAHASDLLDGEEK